MGNTNSSHPLERPNWDGTLYDQQTGFDYGMIVGTFSVIYAAWLMYEKNWREEDED